MEHTKGKWEIGRTGDDADIMIVGGKNRNYVCNVRINQIGGGAIAESMKPEREANARRIVKCVNGYDELIEALKSTRMLNLGLYTSETIGQKVFEIVEKAIKEAENEE